MTGIHYAVMQLSGATHSSLLPAPDSALLHPQDVVNSFYSHGK